MLFYFILKTMLRSALTGPGSIKCRNQQRCLHFWLLLEDPFEQLSGIVKNVDRHGEAALFLIMADSCLRIIQKKTKAVCRRKSVNNATISYTYMNTLVAIVLFIGITSSTQPK